MGTIDGDMGRPGTTPGRKEIDVSLVKKRLAEHREKLRRCTSDNGGGLRCVRLAGHSGDHSIWPQETGT